MSTKATSARANPLVMARNESSTLFSLGDLDASRAATRPQTQIQTQIPSQIPSQIPRRSTPSTKAPASEGSGLIDIHAMRALMTDQASASEARELGPANTAPTFTGLGMGGLVADPLIDVRPAPAPAKPVRPRTPALLYAVIGLLSAGLLGLGAYVALDQPPEQVVQQEIVAAPVVDEAPGEAASEAEQTAPEPEPSEVDASVAEADPSQAEDKPRVRRTNRSRKADSTKDPKPAVSQPAAAEIDVDCLINNKLPKCKTAKPAAKPGEVSEPKPKPAPSDDLAAKLDQSQILAGIGPVKTAAKACGSGTAVTIKFSVEGSSGRVISAKALDEHASTSVGKCVAASAMKASFARFAAAQQGFSFKFRL